ncbi:MAG: hypothetical protein QF822_01955 [Candidatus Poseidoniia archaeon]|nr:hypothetical protein [Euryarchaeota archaeon]MDP6490063.1 hypothetical protein [Candidatus Poseidoniia archaeon]MDP6533973.1 hypothetical protein [Candidatus Poseidoniia archaeon]MDP6834645.1 hypothetical protein [Candidatus Poseidoniia archaeon]HIH79206.1 hypothetical protein [Candidatus Poseidoniia archaeon]
MGILNHQFGVERKREKVTLIALATCSFLTSLYAGYRLDGIGRTIELPLFGIEFHLISTPLWLLAGFATLLCLQQLFHEIWHHGVWLVGIYALTGLGTTLFYVMFDQGYTWYLVTLVLLLLALFLIYWMVLEMYALRSYIQSELPDEKIALSDWLPALPTFMLFTMLSYYCYTKWYLGEDGWTFGYARQGYLLFQLLAFGTGVYALWVPQTLLGRYIEEELQESEVLRKLLPSNGGRCPECSGEMRARGMACPECEEHERVAFCDVCELYVASCSGCGQGAQVGAGCKGCERHMDGLQCSACKHAGPVRFWSST